MRRAQNRNAIRRGYAKIHFADRASGPFLGGVRRVRYFIGGKEVDAFGECLMPPEMFCLENNPDETLKFLHKFRELHLLNLAPGRQHGRGLAGGRKRQWIGTYTNIAAIRIITPAAALVLAAEFDRAVRRSRLGKRGLVDTDSWDLSVARTLSEVGFLKHLQADMPSSFQFSPHTSERRMLQMLIGNQNEPEEAEKLSQGLQEIIISELAPDVSQGIYTGLVEAMDNCVTHAYPEDHIFPYPIEKRWWMSGSVANGEELEVIFFDQGATIPGTLPHSRIAEHARRWLNRVLNVAGFQDANDGQRIRAAMEVGRSMNRQQGRGHGLAHMRRLVDSAASGSLRILSGRGCYIYEKDASETVDTFDRSIDGTLVHWRFRL